MRQEQRILFLGVGKLGGQILDLLLRLPGKYRFLVGGRDLQQLRQRVNLSVSVLMGLSVLSRMALLFLLMRLLKFTLQGMGTGIVETI